MKNKFLFLMLCSLGLLSMCAQSVFAIHLKMTSYDPTEYREDQFASLDAAPEEEVIPTSEESKSIDSDEIEGKLEDEAADEIMKPEKDSKLTALSN